jgi:alpha-beta hydrolase superfamily lysophospholipase
MVRIAPRMPMPVPFDATILTHDEERIAMLKSDALNITQVRLSWFFASERAMAEAVRDVSKVSWPTLWLIAGDDRICASSAARVVYDRLPNPETHRWIDFPGLFHEIHQERQTDFERLVSQVSQWVENHLG